MNLLNKNTYNVSNPLEKILKYSNCSIQRSVSIHNSTVSLFSLSELKKKAACSTSNSFLISS